MAASRRQIGAALAAIAALPRFAADAAMRGDAPVDIRDHGARGDGRALATAAINAAIAAAEVRGGGTVLIPAGRWLCFSIRLRSRVTLLLAPGSVIEAADPARHPGAYDLPEDRGDQLYQDFGHSHWHNSLIWGEDIHDVAIVGPGTIDGRGLTRDGPGARWRAQTGERPLTMRGMTAAEIAALEPSAARMRGLGNKAVALRGGRNIRLAGFMMRRCGHFAILATGTRDLHIADLAIDTDRDGIDLDGVRDTVVERCRVNTPNDDAIVVKSSLALGHPAVAERIVIRDCRVSGYDLGTMLDGSYGATQLLAPDRDRVTGRIKLGTESNGGFRDVRIEDCRFDHGRGLALEMVDGGRMEGVVARRLTMRDVTTAPLFVRLGDRRRGPPGTGIGTVRDVTIAEVDASGIDPRFAATVAGLPGHPVERLRLSDIRLSYRGGGTAADAARRPAALADAYPEPSMFGVLPVWGLWMRHARDVAIGRLHLETEAPDARPPIGVEDVTRVSIRDVPHWPA